MLTSAAHVQGLDEGMAGWIPPPIGTEDGVAPPPRREDAALAAQLANQLVAIARGDQRAFERFYEATLSRVFAVARRICTDHALAEEVAEDVYVQVWREAGRFDATRGAALAWLLMMTRSRALDALRRADPAISVEDPHSLIDSEDAQTHDQDPLKLLDALRRDSEIRSALAALPARDRQMVGLAFLRGLTHAEIAAAMQLPLGTVKTTIRRALGLMRTQLASYAPQRRNEEAGYESDE
jgi:RNA polymerase sigma-70 factor (ECF subfamily)